MCNTPASSALQGFTPGSCSRDATACDIVINHESVSRIHAAIVHHQDGRIFLIDLASVSVVERATQFKLGKAADASSQTHGTYINAGQKRVRATANKPVHLLNGNLLTFGKAPVEYRVVCETTGMQFSLSMARPGSQALVYKLQEKSANLRR